MGGSAVDDLAPRSLIKRRTTVAAMVPARTTQPGARPAQRRVELVAEVAATWLRDHRPGRTRSACFAPHSALYFDPTGSVKACCTTGHQVGRVTGPDRRSIRDIWHGAAQRELRERLEASRFDLGCQECELAIAAGGRPAAMASHFDRWRHGAPHAYPKLLDLALSNRCNLACVMCNGDLSSTIRAQREGREPLRPAYDDAFFAELADFLPHADRVQFKGGEPFLAPENQRVWDLMLELGVECETFIVTNGTVWNDKVERYLRLLRPELTVSVDGTTAEVLEPIRVGTRCDDLWRNIDRFQRVTLENGRVFTLNYCLMTENWHDLPAFLEEVDRRGIRCYVHPVNQPPHLDVLRQPTDQLRHILATYEASRPALATRSPQRQLDQICTLLRAQIASPTTLEVAVALPDPSRAGP